MRSNSTELPASSIERETLDACYGRPFHVLLAKLTAPTCLVCGGRMQNCGFAAWDDETVRALWYCVDRACSDFEFARVQRIDVIEPRP